MSFFKIIVEDEESLRNIELSDLYMFYNFEPKYGLLNETLMNLNGEDLYIYNPKKLDSRLLKYAENFIKLGANLVIYYSCDFFNINEYNRVCSVAKTLNLYKVPIFWNISDLNIFLGYFYSIQQINSNKLLMEDGILAIVSALEGLQHTYNVRVLSEKMAIMMGMSGDLVKNIGLAASVHDIGKIFIPSSILNKKGKLTKTERGIMEMHTIWGSYLIKEMKFLDNDFKELASSICAFHHERLDGSGYPYKLSGDDIKPEVQIVSLVDVYDALVNNRPYRSAVDKDIAISYLVANKEKFGSRNIDIFLEIIEDFDDIGNIKKELK
ncbi:MAG: HD domain-containing protein [Candidatus Micrarchaeia archaeon]